MKLSTLKKATELIKLRDDAIKLNNSIKEKYQVFEIYVQNKNNTTVFIRPEHHKIVETITKALLASIEQSLKDEGIEIELD